MLTPIIEYFANLAAIHPEIQHTDQKPAFFDGDIDEIILQLSEGSNGAISDGWLMCLEHETGSIIGNNEDQTMDSPDFAILILKPIAGFDATLRREIADKSKQIGFEVIKKMVHDRDQVGSFLTDFDPMRVRYQKVVGAAGKYNGYRLAFSLQINLDLTYDTDTWN